MMDHSSSDPSALVTPIAAIFNAPLRTSCRIDMQALLSAKYQPWTNLWEPDGELTGTPWREAGARQRSNKMIFDVDDYQGAGKAAYLATAQLDVRVLTQARLEGLLVESGVLRFYDFGIATLTVNARFTEEEYAGYSSLLARIEVVSSVLAEETQTWCSSRISELLEAVPSSLILQGEASEEDFGLAPAGVPMWMHRVLVSRPASSGQLPETNRTSINSHPCFVVGTHVCFYEKGYGRAWFGHGTSVVELETATGQTPLAVHRMIDLSNAYWSGAQELGTLVLLRQRDLAAFRKLKNTRVLEDEAYGLVELHDQLALFRALVNDQLNRLHLTDRSIFERIGDCWRFNDLMNEVDRRRSDLAEIHDQALRRIQADETSRLNLVVFGLTMISAAVIVTDLVQFGQEQSFRAPDIWRSAVVGVVILGLLYVGWRVARTASFVKRRLVRVHRASMLLDEPVERPR